MPEAAIQVEGLGKHYYIGEMDPTRHATLEGCRCDLRESLSDWIALRLRLGLEIPIVAGINLNELTQPV